MRSLRVKIPYAEDPESPSPSDTARIQTLEEIVRFIKGQNSSSVLEIELCQTDKEAMERGWQSAETQRQALLEIVSTLPVDVAQRVKLVEAGTTCARDGAGKRMT